MNKIKGFTLVELLIIISILAIITKLSFFKGGEKIDRTEDFADKQTLEQIAYTVDGGKAIGLSDVELKNIIKKTLIDLDLYEGTGTTLTESLCGGPNIDSALNFLVSRETNKGVNNCKKGRVKLSD